MHTRVWKWEVFSAPLFFPACQCPLLQCLGPSYIGLGYVGKGNVGTTDTKNRHAIPKGTVEAYPTVDISSAALGHSCKTTYLTYPQVGIFSLQNGFTCVHVSACMCVMCVHVGLCVMCVCM